MNKLYFGDNIKGLLAGTERPDYTDASFDALTHKKAQVEKKPKRAGGVVLTVGARAECPYEDQFTA